MSPSLKQIEDKLLAKQKKMNTLKNEIEVLTKVYETMKANKEIQNEEKAFRQSLKTLKKD